MQVGMLREEDRFKVRSHVLKIGRLAIVGTDAAPVRLCPPWLLIYLYGGVGRFFLTPQHRDSEPIHLLGATDIAPVAVGLFLVRLIHYQRYLFIRQNLCKVGQARQIVQFYT